LLLNPLAAIIEVIRDGVLTGAASPAPLLVPGLLAITLVAVAWFVTPRFLARIEDFL